MPGPDRDRPTSLVDAIKNIFDTASDGEDGSGPTLGQNFSRKSATLTPAAIDGTAVAPEDPADEARLAGEISVAQPREEP